MIIFLHHPRQPKICNRVGKKYKSKEPLMVVLHRIKAQLHDNVLTENSRRKPASEARFTALQKNERILTVI